MSKTMERADFIDEKFIYDTLEAAKNRSVEELNQIIEKARQARV